MIFCIKACHQKVIIQVLLVGQEVQHAADMWQGQIRATRRQNITHLVYKLVSLTTGELKQVENWLQLKRVQRKQTNASFPMQLD